MPNAPAPAASATSASAIDAAHTAPSARRRRVQSAETGMGILKALARLGGAASLTALAQAVDESTAKVHRYLASMLEEGLVVQDEGSQRYVLGPEAIHIGLAALRQCDPIRAGESALLRLQAELGVTCFIAVMGNLGPTILRIEEPPLAVVVNVRAGSVLPLLWSATGQVFMALRAAPALQAQARQEWARATPRQRAALPDDGAIDALCEQVRAQGFASVQDLLLPGISAAAAPLRRHDGAVVGAITALGATGGFDAQPGSDAVARLCAAAASVSAQLGFAGLPSPR